MATKLSIVTRNILNQHYLQGFRANGYMPELKDIFKEQIRTDSKRVQRDSQRGLFGQIDSVHTKIGDFYEYLSAGLFGGKVGNVITISEGEDDGSGFSDNDEAYPDVYNEERRLFVESKALHSSTILKLEDDQVARYRRLMNKFRDHTLTYGIYFHSMGKVRSIGGSESEIFERASRATLCGLILDHEIIEALHQSRNKDLVYRYDEGNRKSGGEWDYTGVKPATFKRMLEDPKENTGPNEILWKIGLDPANYGIERRLLPLNMKIEGNTLNLFPLIRISRDASSTNVKPDDNVPF